MTASKAPFAKLRTAAFVLAALAAATLARPASASDCAPYPEATWWGSISHAKVIDYVFARFDGDWDKYLAKWDRRLDTAVHALDREVPLVFRSSGVELEGDSLAFYISQLRQRIAVSRCLAAEAQARETRVAAQVTQQDTQ